MKKDIKTQRKRYTEKHIQKESRQIFFYPWSIRYKFENTLYGEAEGEREVHVAKNVRQQQRCAVVLIYMEGGRNKNTDMSNSTSI